MSNLRKIIPITIYNTKKIVCENRILNIKMKRMRQRDNLCIEYYQCNKSALDPILNKIIRCTFSGKVTYNKGTKPTTLELIRNHLNHLSFNSSTMPCYNQGTQIKNDDESKSVELEVEENTEQYSKWTFMRPKRKFDYELTSIDPDNESEVIDINHDYA